MRSERSHVLGVPVDNVSEPDVLAFVRDWVAGGDPAQIVTVNAEFVVRARRDVEFRNVLKHAALATPDGAGVVWALRRRGVNVPARVGGSDLVWSVSEQAARLGHRLFLLGGAEGVARTAAARLQDEYPGLIVAGTYSGSPDMAEQNHIVDLIRRSRADVLLVAFGAPAQELWVARSLVSAGVSVALGVGGSLDYVAGTARRAPAWMRERGLEWLWRLVLQPWRWRRMLALPRFVCLVLLDEWARWRKEPE